MKKGQSLWAERSLLFMETSGCMRGVQRKFIHSAQLWGSLYYVPDSSHNPFFLILTTTL